MIILKNSFRAVTFIIPFLMIVLSITYIIPNIPGIENGTLFFSLLIFLIIGVFPLIQGGIRYFYFNKYKYQGKYFFNIPLGESKLFQRVLYDLLIFIILIFPIIGRGFNISNLTQWNILVTFGFIALAEVILFITYRFTKIHFLSSGILIHGPDFRMDLPMGTPLKSHSGFYFYGEIHSYEIKKNHLTLHIDNNDKIEGMITQDIRAQVLSFLSNKGIPMKK